MLRWVSGVNNVANVHPVQERPLDLLPEGKDLIILVMVFYNGTSNLSISIRFLAEIIIPMFTATYYSFSLLNSG